MKEGLNRREFLFGASLAGVGVGAIGSFADSVVRRCGF